MSFEAGDQIFYVIECQEEDGSLVWDVIRDCPVTLGNDHDLGLGPYDDCQEAERLRDRYNSEEAQLWNMTPEERAAILTKPEHELHSMASFLSRIRTFPEQKMTDEKKKKKKKLKYITLIWEELPENISYYVIPRSEIEKADLKMLKACHNNWINSTAVDTTRAEKDTVDRALCRINNMLVDPSLEWINDKYRDEQAGYCGVTREEFDEFVGKWYGYKLDTESPRTLPRSRLYRSGFLT